MADPGGFCLSCGMNTKDKCSRCHSSHYCSKECLKADWPTHKLLCRSYSAFDLTSRPSKEHFLGIIFPQDKHQPHLTWLHCPFDDPDEFQVPDFEPHLSAGRNASITGALVHFSTVQDRELPDLVHVVYRDKFFYDGYSLPNLAVRAVTQKPGVAHFDWRGPILVYVTVGQLDMQCRDIDLSDYRHAVDFLRSKSGEGLNPLQALQHSGTKAVRINCHGARETHGVPCLEAITISSGHPVFYAHDCPTIPARIGFKLCTARDPQDPAWTGIAPAKNIDATSLHLSCRDDETWGQSPASWPRKEEKVRSVVDAPPWPRNGEIGSLLVMRADGLPLDPLQLEAMVRFCQGEVTPLFAQTLPRQVVLAAITKPVFEEFCVKFVREKRERGSSRAERV